MYDRFMIAPINSGLQTDLLPLLDKNASSRYYYKISKGCFMKLRKDAKDLTGQVFFDLTVLYPIKKGKYRGVIWKCKCVCGNEADVYGGHLRAGHRKSCGCRSERFIDQTGVKRLYSNYISGAKRRNLPFELSLDEFGDFIKGNCYYCGSTPTNILKRLKSRKLQIIYNGVDRLEHEKGYIKENCVSACRYCNIAKSDLSLEQFKEQLRRICKWLMIDL